MEQQQQQQLHDVNDLMTHNINTTRSKTEIVFTINENVTKYKVSAPQGYLSVVDFRMIVSQKQKDKLNEEWALFSANNAEMKLLVVKEDQSLTYSNDYFIIFNSQVQHLTKKLERRIKKDHDAGIQKTPGGKFIYTSDNSPMQVDYIPDDELLMSEVGRIGICMAPGRCKKKKIHDWARDLSKDLDRIRNVYECDVLVSLVRRSELIDLGTPHLIEEVRKRGMEAIHFPIKDKWVPNSMEQLINLVSLIITRLRQAKTVVVHCNGGKGRSGTVVVATLVGLGKTVQEAIDVVRKARSGTIRNPLQIAYVKRFRTAWAKRKQAGTKGKSSESSTSSSIFSTGTPSGSGGYVNDKLGYVTDDEDDDDGRLNDEELLALQKFQETANESDDEEERITTLTATTSNTNITSEVTKPNNNDVNTNVQQSTSDALSTTTTTTTVMTPPTPSATLNDPKSSTTQTAPQSNEGGIVTPIKINPQQNSNSSNVPPLPSPSLTTSASKRGLMSFFKKPDSRPGVNSSGTAAATNSSSSTTSDSKKSKKKDSKDTRKVESTPKEKKKNQQQQQQQQQQPSLPSSPSQTEKEKEKLKLTSSQPDNHHANLFKHDEIEVMEGEESSESHNINNANALVTAPTVSNPVATVSSSQNVSVSTPADSDH
eukprot:TRINITY_DN689_c1_g4_i1.p1 TRINITY_DN689_c1_g4~~TRINITY_DN689_c1_g4_i1.p1  ORF type:complete len:653 (-),score=260.66 TRINITY_DN689_c1_g4_i1:162-2120(-)